MKKITLFLMSLMLLLTAGTANAAVYFKGSMNGWGTSNEMISEGSNNYSCTLTIPKDATFKVNDGNNWYGYSSSISTVGTYTLSSSAGDAKWSGNNIYAKVTWNSSSKKLTIAEAQAETIEIPEGLVYYEGQFSVFVVNNKNWSKINAWIWGASNYTGGNWPGQAMTKLDVKAGDYDCYQWTYTGNLSAMPTGAIFNNGSAQTADLTYVNGGVYTTEGTLLGTIEPTVVVEPTITMGINPEVVYVDDKVTFTVHAYNADGKTIKFTTNDTEQTSVVEGDEYTATFTHTYTEAATFTATAALVENPEVVVEKEVVVNEHTYLTFTVTVPAGTTNVNIAGSFNNWSTEATAMEDQGNNVFTVTVKDVDANDVQYKYVTNKSWDNEEVTASEGQVNNRTYNANDVVEKWKGIALQVTTETLTYNVTVPAGTPACYIAGEMNGWSFTAMTMVDDTHYTITLDNVTKAMKYKYSASNNWDNVEMQADGVTDVADRTYTEDDFVVAWKGLDLQPATETLTYNVTVPYGTETCYIVGEVTGGWDIFIEMTKVGDNQFTATFYEVTKAMKYKYSANEGWDNVEMQADGTTDVADRTWAENDVVAAWKLTTGVDAIENNAAQILGGNGKITVRTAEATTINIYNTQGMLIQSTVVEGAMDITLAKGMYIVNRNKVLVH